VLIATKILIALSVVGLLQCSEWFRNSSREFDERALGALKQMARVAEDAGLPAAFGPMLILLSALYIMLMQFH
jgi:hypothetical protein